MNIIRLTSESQIKSLIQAINLINTPISLDLETTGLDPRKDQLLSVVLGVPDRRVHGGFSAFVFDGISAKYIKDITAPLILHNFKFDYTFLFHKEVDILDRECRDTMLMHHLWDENKPHGLDAIIQELWQDPYKAEFWAKYKDFKDAPEAEADQYAGKDAIYTLKLYYKLVAYLDDMSIPKHLIEHTHDFAHALLKTELEGVCVDLRAVRDRGIECKIKITELEKGLRALAAEPIAAIEQELYEKELDKRKTDRGKAGVSRPVFNLSSTAQLQTLLYDELNLPVQRSSQRKPTVDDAALAKLEDHHPFVRVLRDYRGEQKLFTAFLETAIEKVREGRIYPSFNVNGTVTGRISASNPNLQQLPSTGNIRSIYIPAPGSAFISADYSQLEVTLAAHFSRDKNLLRVITEGISLHDITAQGLGIDRSLAKTINFAIQYGAGVKKIQKILKCGEEEATLALKKYWDTYPGLKALIDKCHACVDRGEAIANPFGRQRHLHVDNPQDKWAVAGVKRQAFNSLIQGTGADITNTAFVRISEELVNSNEGRALFPVHDEILIECKAESVLYWESRLKDIMISIGRGINLSVPLTVQTSGGMAAWLD